VLDAVLGLWTEVLADEVPEAKPWLYMDDRSIRVNEKVSEADEIEILEAALVCTAKFDTAIGVEENTKKRQKWADEDLVEHLGLLIEGDGQATHGPALPRDDGEGIKLSLGRLARIPGSIETRAKLVAIFIAAKWSWACPLTKLPDLWVLESVFQAVLQTRCTWWCKGRFFAERLNIHPRASVAVRTLTEASCLDGSNVSLVMWAAVKEAAAWLYMRVRSWTIEGLVLICVRENANVEAIVAHAATRRHGGIQPNAPGGAHVLRIVARARLLADINKGRWDRDGVEDVDLEAQSHKAWTHWKKTLSHAEGVRLLVWRAGAVKTQTRMGDGEPCTHCGYPLPSARHLWAECPEFDDKRKELSLLFGIPRNWWRHQPRITAKTAWITMTGGASTQQRAERQIASALMGIEILRRMGFAGY
jgi:hypothetical protein